MSRRRSGLTVLELVVVIAIIGVLLALVLPAVQAVRESARNQQCLHRLRQLGLALHSYHEVERTLPPGWRLDARRETAFGWGTALLPFLEQQPLYRTIDTDAAVTSPANRQLAEAMLPIYCCPSDHGPEQFALYAEKGEHESLHQDSQTILATLPRSNYVAIFGISDPDASPGDRGEGTFVEDRGVRFAEVVRGLSQVVLIGERSTRKLPSSWFGFVVDGEDAAGRVAANLFRGPNRDDADECELDSRHTGHVNFVWADGHATSIADDVDGEVYRRLAQRY